MNACTDVSNKKQVPLCFWWVDDEFEIYEDFLGFENIRKNYLQTAQDSEFFVQLGGQ